MSTLVFYCRSKNIDSLRQGLEASACCLALGREVKVIFHPEALKIIKSAAHVSSVLNFNDYFLILEKNWLELTDEKAFALLIQTAQSVMVF